MNWYQRLIGSKEARNAGWLIGGKAAQMVLSFAVSVFTARYLGPGNYGLINYAAAYIAFFSSLCNLGLNNVLLKDLVDHPQEQGTSIGTALVMRLVSSFLSAVMILGIVCVADRGERTTIAVVALSSVSLLFQVCDTFDYWFQSRYESKVTSIAALISYAVMAVYKLMLLALGKSVIWFALATSVNYISLGAITYRAYIKRGGQRLCCSRKKGKKLLTVSYHYILSGMMVCVYGQTDKLMLKKMLDETNVGYYSLASTINGMWVFVLAAIITSMYPTIVRLYGIDRAAFEKKNRQLYAIVIWLSAVVAIGFTVFGRLVIGFVYGKAYMPAAAPLSIVAWYTGFSYLGVARNAWILCEGKQKYLKYMYFTAAVLNVTLNWFMIPVMGVNGAALASVITQICTSVLIPALIPDMRPNVKMMLDALLLRGIR